jgi:hypothetical protein
MPVSPFENEPGGNRAPLVGLAIVAATFVAAAVVANPGYRGTAAATVAVPPAPRAPLVYVGAAVVPTSGPPRLRSRRERIRAIICGVFGARCAPAFRVALCETGRTLNRFAVGDEGERGLFQIHPVHFGWLDERRLFEVRYNAIAASRLSRNGRNWRHWSCQP